MTKRRLFHLSLIILGLFLVAIILAIVLNKKPSSDGMDQNQSQQQTEDDKNFAEALDELHRQYPWYSQLPIVNENFAIAFNFAKNSFRIVFYVPSTPKLQAEAVSELEAIGVDLNKYGYYFVEPKKTGFENLLN